LVSLAISVDKTPHEANVTNANLPFSLPPLKDKKLLIKKKKCGEK